MKKVILLILLSHLFSSIQVNAQTFCHTPSSIPNSLENIQTRFISNNGPFTIRLFFHVIRQTNGTGGRDINVANTAFDILTEDYSQLNINFSLLGSEYIDNDDFFNFNDDETCGGCGSDRDCDFTQLIATNKHSDAIDIYILPLNVYNAGRASGIPGTALVIGGDYPTTHVISHELGHCLGLFHTFHGTPADADCSGQYGSPEMVNRTYALQTGDYVVDTPADPVILMNYLPSYSCIWDNKTMRDANGELFDPDETLIMSYTRSGCMEKLTAGQGERMRNTIATSSILQPCMVPNDIFVQNEFFSSGQHNLEALNSIVAGNNVTSGTQGIVVIEESANVEFKSHDHITLKPGVYIIPDIYGKFKATIINEPLQKSAKIIHSEIAEAYQPFLNNSTWFSVSQGFEGYINSNFTTEKDTTFNGFTYTKITERFVGLPDITNNKINWGSAQIVYFVREDVSSRKVYQYFKGSGDQLLYDFSLQVGAILPQSIAFELKTVDLVEGPDGLRKRFVFKDKEDEQIIWIEGIGNISAPFIPDAGFRDWQKLICASQNGISTYQFVNKDGINCNLSKRTIAKTDENTIMPASIYPNPTKGLFRIVFNEYVSAEKTIRILDVNGKTISLIGNFEGLDHIDIDITTLPNGLYFCVINSENKTSSFRIIKQ